MTSSVSRPASQTNGRQAQWTFHETCRLAHVILDPSVGAALARSATGLTRPELDARLATPFDAEFFQLFNNPEFQPAHPDPTNIHLAGMDAKMFTRREGYTLKTKYSDLRKEFTIVYDNWSRSGQNNPHNFWDFCHGRKVILYSFLVWKNSPSLDMVLKTVPDCESLVFILRT